MFVCRQVDWRKIASLTMSAVSSSFRAHFSMHSLKSAISLSLKLLLLLHQPRLARNPYSGLELGPTQASLRSLTAIMITTSNSSSYEEERDAQSITRCSTAHHGDFRAVPRANRTWSPARNPIPGASSSTVQPPVGGPWRPWQSSVLVASPGGSTGCATLAHCAL